MTRNPFEAKTVLVTGGTGTIGEEIVRQLIPKKPASLRVFSNDENGQHLTRQRFGDNQVIRFLLGDVRSLARLDRAMKNVDLVFHAAALKHVDFCEYNPFEAVETNVIGTQNVLNAALENDVDAVVAISTDKAVNPVSTMGATKLLAERLVTDANYYKGNARTRFWSVRFGNVLNSRGSLIPLVRDHVREGKAVQVTNPNMTRFIIPLEDAVSVVLKTVEYCEGGEVIVPNAMTVVRIGDLVSALIDEATTQIGTNRVGIDYIGPRSGERFHEYLLSPEESAIAERKGDVYVIRPRTQQRRRATDAQDGTEAGPPGPGVSSDQFRPLSVAEIKRLIRELKLP